MDTVGKLTVGYGRNLEDKGISQKEAEVLLQNDVVECEWKCSTTFRFFGSLDPVRQDCLIEMCFNLGLGGLCKFKKMLLAIESSDWKQAHDEALDSKWAVQVGARATEIAQMLLTGVPA